MGVGAQTGWLLTAYGRHCLLWWLCAGSRKRTRANVSTGREACYRGPLTSLSPLWRRRPLSGLLLLCSWQEPKQTVVSFVLGKGRLNIVDNMSVYMNCHSYTVKQIQAQYEKIFSNWFTVVFDMKDRASLITRRSILTLCASKSSFNNNDSVCFPSRTWRLLFTECIMSLWKGLWFHL